MYRFWSDPDLASFPKTLTKMTSLFSLSTSLLGLMIALTACAQEAAQQTNSTNPQPGVSYTSPPCDGQDGCDVIYSESPVPLTQLNAVDTLPDFATDARKMLVTGMVVKPDGRTPAANVVVYIYHTNQQGIYPKRAGLLPVGRWHGYLRGWVRTNERGEYFFYTCRPAHYPSGDIPEHIHIHVKEPDKSDYWIDDFMFNEDPVLSAAERNRQQKRGGSGICQLTTQNGLLLCRRNITLGLNIPNYPNHGR